MPIIVRFSKASIADLRFQFPSPGTVFLISTIKKQIRKERSDETKRRRLRLIYGGRVLSDSVDFAEIIKPILERNSISQSTEGIEKSTSQIKDASDDSLLNDEPFNVFLHCSVGDLLGENELFEVDTGSQPVPSTVPRPVGFDRLRSAGFSEQDIAQLRLQFNRLHGGNVGDTDDETRQMEERWIDEGAHAQDTLADGSPIGAYEDLFLGTIVGFFFGFLSLFFLREGGIFTKRQQMAIVAGLIVNVSFAILRVYY
ncbi:DUF2407 C-terminal domain-containing protein [Dipodascopsis tothii]|uniref:DUF2407 C-terminal domain-containing protein n=1 Tax=Dipodascopsis tothii TaxID=44089 RepID=UPI0034CF697A